MLGANLFLKAIPRIREYTHQDNMRDMERRARLDSMPKLMKGTINNDSVRPFVGHSRFGFQTLLNTHSSVPLPTAPAIVGGNVDWTKSKVTPITQHLHDSLNKVRPMNPVPALGSLLKMVEPNVNSLHTH